MKSNKFFNEHEVILRTKIGWNVVYYKYLIKHKAPGYVTLDNNVRYSGASGREIGTSTPDYIFKLQDKNDEGKTYLELFQEQY